MLYLYQNRQSAGNLWYLFKLFYYFLEVSFFFLCIYFRFFLVVSQYRYWKMAWIFTFWFCFSYLYGSLRPTYVCFSYFLCILFLDFWFLAVYWFLRFSVFTYIISSFLHESLSLWHYTWIFFLHFLNNKISYISRISLKKSPKQTHSPTMANYNSHHWKIRIIIFSHPNTSQLSSLSQWNHKNLSSRTWKVTNFIAILF